MQIIAARQCLEGQPDIPATYIKNTSAGAA